MNANTVAIGDFIFVGFKVKLYHFSANSISVTFNLFL